MREGPVGRALGLARFGTGGDPSLTLGSGSSAGCATRSAGVDVAVPGEGDADAAVRVDQCDLDPSGGSTPYCATDRPTPSSS